MTEHVSPQTALPPRLYRLAEAVSAFFPQGGITVKSLRTEARAGRLSIIRIANKDFVTAEAIQSMLERCTCRASENRPVSISANATDASRNGSSLTERVKSAQAALHEIIKTQKRRP